MKNSLLNYYKYHPFRTLLIVGIFFRIIAAIFSEGFAFQDDHFLVIEKAQHWVDGIKNDWLPKYGGKHASGNSFLYPGLHYILFEILHFFGLDNPNVKMLIVRILHAFYNLLIVYFGFKITKILSNQQSAIRVSWLLSIFWVFPLLSVRNLVEYVCIVPLLYSLYLILKNPPSTSFIRYLLIGFIAGIAFSIRFQTILFIGGFGLVFLLNKQFLQAIYFGIGALLSIVIFQGIVDYIIWGQPFAEFIEYTNYNLYHSGDYPNGPWYNYTLLLLGLFILPLGFYFFWGMGFRFKKYIWLTLPTAIFFVFHSYFPNKQERFILTMLPMFIMAGSMGWDEFCVKSKWWQKHQNTNKNIWRWIWTINTLLLLFLTPASTKVSKLRVMNYFRERGDVSYFVLETTQMWGSVLMPRFYHGVWNETYLVTQEHSAKELFEAINSSQSPKPSHVVFAEPKDLDIRVQRVKDQVKNLVFEKQIESSYLDKTMVWLNPVNVNQTYYIYRIEY